MKLHLCMLKHIRANAADLLSRAGQFVRWPECLPSLGICCQGYSALGLGGDQVSQVTTLQNQNWDYCREGLGILLHNSEHCKT